MNYADKVIGRRYPNSHKTILHMYNWDDGTISYYPFIEIAGHPELVAIFRCKPKPVPPTEVFQDDIDTDLNV